jgi:hypothetical protein
MADWRSRAHLQPSTLFNLCLAFREAGRYHDAMEAVRYGLEKHGRSGGGADLLLFSAVEEALAGNTETAARQMNEVSIRPNVAYDQYLLGITKALVEFQQASPQARRESFSIVRRRLGDTFRQRQLWRCSRDVRQTFRRAGCSFAANGAGWQARRWFALRLHWQWLACPCLLVFVLVPPLVIPAAAALLLTRILRNR